MRPLLSHAGVGDQRSGRDFRGGAEHERQAALGTLVRSASTSFTSFWTECPVHRTQLNERSASPPVKRAGTSGSSYKLTVRYNHALWAQPPVEDTSTVCSRLERKCPPGPHQQLRTHVHPPQELSHAVWNRSAGRPVPRSTTSWKLKLRLGPLRQGPGKSRPSPSENCPWALLGNFSACAMPKTGVAELGRGRLRLM